MWSGRKALLFWAALGHGQRSRQASAVPQDQRQLAARCTILDISIAELAGWLAVSPPSSLHLLVPSPPRPLLVGFSHA